MTINFLQAIGSSISKHQKHECYAKKDHQARDRNRNDYWWANLNFWSFSQVKFHYALSITAAVAIINLILSILPSKPSYYQVPSVILAKVYSNSMMAVLNSRMKLGGESGEENGTSIIKTIVTSRHTDAYGHGEGETISDPKKQYV